MPTPFINAAGTPLPLENHYRGAHAFLIGGGPSLSDYDLQPLGRRWSMTLNNAGKTFRGNANCTLDLPSSFSLSTWLDPTIMKFMPARHFSATLWDNRCLDATQRWQPSALTPADCPNVLGFRRSATFDASRWLHEEKINCGQRGGLGGLSVLVAALRILFVLGFRRVYLLGVDFHMSEGRPYHFAEQRDAVEVSINQQSYEKQQKMLSELQPFFLGAGYVVKNCNPKSLLTAFPQLDYREALAESGAALGDVAAERTLGMYDPKKQASP